MGGCSVIGCKNRVEKGGKHFYRFPKNEKRRFWAIFTKRGLNWTPKDSNTICEVHFAENCFVTKQKRMFLTKESVPTIYYNETETGIEKCVIPFDGNFENYCSYLKQEEDLETELDSSRKQARLNEIKTLCRFCCTKNDVLIEIKNFEAYNIDISVLYSVLELNVESNTYLSNLVCEECFNQIVLLDTFKTKCKNAEIRILSELQVLVPDFKVSSQIQTYPIMEIVGSLENEEDKSLVLLNSENHHDTIYEDPDNYQIIDSVENYEETFIESLTESPQLQVPDSLIESNIEEVEGMDVYDGDRDPEEIIKNPKRNKFVLKVFECLFCKKKFGGKRTFKTHACDVKEIKCDQCDKVFDRPQAYKSHKAHSHGDNQLEKYYCPMCKAVITGNLSRFQQHRKKCNKERTNPIECEICKKQISSLNGYTIHKMFHDSVKHNGESLLRSEKPIGDTVCELCGKTFKTTSGYRTHKLTTHTTTDEIFQCEICKKICSSKPALSDHKRNSHKVQESPCNICGKVFRTKVLLRKHKIYHDETKRIFKCQFCPDKPGYFTRVALKRHQQMHCGDRPFSCEFCDMSYSSNHQLKQHLLTKHETHQEEMLVTNQEEDTIQENPIQYQIQEVQELTSDGNQSQTILTITQIY